MAHCLAGLPIEILEQIFLHLPGQDIIKLEAISRQFQDLTRNSPTLRYQRDLFSASLVENHCVPCDFAQRRKLCEEHKRKWSGEGRVVKTVHGSPGGLLPPTRIFCRDLVASRSARDNGLHFFRILPGRSKESIEQWSIPPLPFNIKAFAAYSPNNVLVVAEENEQFIYIHLLNLSDGSPHRAPPSNVIMWKIPQRTNGLSVGGLTITGSRVALHVCYWEVVQHASPCVWRIFVWDWKVGNLVLDRPFPNGSMFGTGVAFLDEFKMMVWTLSGAMGVPEFTVFDTLIPCGLPVHSRRFRLPSRYQNWWPSVYIDGDTCLGTPDRDRPLTTDPSQAVIVVELVGYSGRRILIIVRIQALIGHMHSAGADGCVPWNKWGGGATVVEGDHGDGYPLVKGARVILAKMGTSSRFRTFDFSRGGCSDGTERGVLFSGGRDLLLQGSENVAERGSDSLDISNFTYLGGILDPDGALHVWELI